MYITVYSPGGDSITGDFRARFQVLGGTPPHIDSDTTVSIAGESIILHQTTYNIQTGEFVLPFTLQSGSLDGTETSIGLLTILGVSTQQLKLLAIEKDIPIPDEAWLLLVAGIIIFFILKG